MEAKDWFEEGCDWDDKKDYSKALDCFNKAIELAPNYANAYYYKGSVLYNLNKYQEAIKCYDIAIECFDKNEFYKKKAAITYSDKGCALNHLGKHHEAMKCHNIAIELDPNKTSEYSCIGNTLEYLGKHHEAMKYFNIAIELNPDYLAYRGRGMVYRRMGKNSEAIADYNKAIELNPNCENACYYKGIVLEKLSKYKEAVKCYEQVLTINPNHFDSAARRNTILLNMPTQKEEYINTTLQEFDKMLNYGFSATFSRVNKNDVEQKIVNQLPKNIETARQRIDKTMEDFNTITNYETQIAKCTPDEFPIAITIYYYITGKISADTASVLLLYFRKKMNDESLKNFVNVMKASNISINIIFVCIEFLVSLQDVFISKIWQEKIEYEQFKEYLPIFLRAERQRLGDDIFVKKYYFENHLKEYGKIFELTQNRTLP
ncbi:MAG: tetratricopeptide repeat protein [Bacteroidetes bacterium]|nr:tetratricopeptide repeat protein [Bacteroidota bacterium]